MKILISSSMKFRNIVKETMQKLEVLGHEPLCPNIDVADGNGDVAKTKEEKAKLAWDYYNLVEKADAIYFILPDGYMGTSVKLELGYVLAFKKPIYFSEETNDIALDCYITKVIPLDKLELFDLGN